MKAVSFKYAFLLTALLLMTAILAQPPASHATMENYCLVPPYVKRDVSTNIMIVMDNSDDMNGRAYTTAYDSAQSYLGYFDPTGCYQYDPAGHNNRWWRVANATAFACGGAGQFSGNVLNWATMSRLSVLKRVLVGGNLQPQVSYTPNYINLEGGGWTATVGACNYAVSTASRLTTTGTCPAALANAVLNIDINYTGPGGTPREAVSGLLQELNDIDQNLNPDINSPRTGLIDFGNNDVPRINQCLPFQNTLQAFMNSIAQGSTVTSSALANATKLATDYYAGTATCSTRDPYNSCASWEPSCTGPVSCRKSFVLMLSTGSNVTNTAAYPPYTPSPLCDTDAAFPFTSNLPLVRNACYGATTDLRAGMTGLQTYLTYVVHTFGSNTNENTLKATASAGQGTYYSAGEGNLEAVLRQAFQDMLRRAASGTAASVLASGEGSGANLVQAVFYPRTMTTFQGGIFGSEINWIGRLSNYWYYVDPFFASSTILDDDSGGGAQDKILNLSNDKKITFRFDTGLNITVADRYNFGPPPTPFGSPIAFEKTKFLWEAGLQLWNRTSARTIYIPSSVIGAQNPANSNLNYFSTANQGALFPYLNLSTVATDDLNTDTILNADDANVLINYIHGTDFSNLRSRTTAVDLDGNGIISGAAEAARVWKLGDILHSTPRISTWVPANTYHDKYADTTYGSGSSVGYINTAGYKNRGMVFAGGNDGMLHAFKLGKLELYASDQYPLVGTLSNPDGYLGGSSIELGHEMWSFIPKNALPYLKYIADPGYCHVYTVDLSPYIFDASICAPGSCTGDYWNETKDVSSWRTILIGGMRYGGACRDLTGSCNSTTATLPDCVKTPVTGNGFSSYFALDVTDQNNPTLLWEFSNPALGFATTGPAIVKINGRTISGSVSNADTSKNGRWFVVFASGPTGPIRTSDQQFLGRSDQNLKLFVLDLKTGNQLQMTSAGSSTTGFDTGQPFAFAGSMLNTNIDTDLDYQDDVVYIPYVKKCETTVAGVCTQTTPRTWTNGGIGRIWTNEDINGTTLTATGNTALNPANWQWRNLMDNIGPVTSSIASLRNKNTNQLWLYYGTGRYYFEEGASPDDSTAQRRLFGLKDLCFSSGFDACPSTPVSIASLTDRTTVSNAAITNQGWYIDLDLCTTSAGASVACTNAAAAFRTERVITDPLATTSGLVFFTTYKPYTDECAFGGKSAIWAVKYDTGGAPGALLKGKALVQVSTGAIEQVDLSSSVFSEKGGRRSYAMEGVPPTAQGLSLLSTPPPVKRVIHMRER